MGKTRRAYEPAGPRVEGNGVEGQAVDLGPHLPIAVYTSSEPWNPNRIGAVTVYCSDGRWGDAMDEFCHRSLNLPRYDRFAVPGGPAWLVSADSSADYAVAAREQLDFLVRVHELERIVLIAHYGCAFYTAKHDCEPRQALPFQLDDLKQAACALGEWFPGLRVDAFLAMRQESQISFHALDSLFPGAPLTADVSPGHNSMV